MLLYERHESLPAVTRPNLPQNITKIATPPQEIARGRGASRFANVAVWVPSIVQ